MLVVVKVVVVAVGVLPDLFQVVVTGVMVHNGRHVVKLSTSFFTLSSQENSYQE